MMGLPSYLVSVAYAFGLLLVFVGERLIETGHSRLVASAAGCVLVLAALVTRGMRATRAKDERARVERALLWLPMLGVVALLCYFAQSDVLGAFLAKPLSQSAPTLSTVLEALVPILLATSLLPLALVELAYASMAQAPHVELGRIRDALLSGLGLAFALVFAFAVYYVADERDVKADLAYFRAARPGTATRSLVRALAEPIQVSVFFPPHNDVGHSVDEYFKDLGSESQKLQVTRYDQAVDVARARELGVTANGAVVISKGARREQLLLGLELDKARNDLRTLDADVQKRLYSVARSKRTLYFTTGHGERSETHVGPFDRRDTLRTLRDLLRAQNEELKDLGAAEGLAVDVPKDAAAVLVIGPTSDFLPEELASLKRYVDNGGRMLIALDPEAGLPFAGLVAPWYLTFTPTQLCDDQVYLPRLHQPSDRTNLATTSFSSHPSVTTLSQYSRRMGLILLGAGFLDAQGKKPPMVSQDFAVRAHAASWNDANANFELDAPAEARKPYPLMAAVSIRQGKQEARGVIVADSDALADVVMENPGNKYFAVDAVKWLVGDDAMGTTETETDPPVEHTRGQDVAWFYSTVFVVPAAVLGLGFGVTRKRRRKS